LKIPCSKLQGIFDRKECARFCGSRGPGVQWKNAHGAVCTWSLTARILRSPVSTVVPPWPAIPIRPIKRISPSI